MGAYLRDQLEGLRSRYPVIREIRGRGLILGMELAAPGQELVKSCLEKGLVINCTQDTVLRFVPPLIIDRNDVDRCIQILSEVLREKTP